MKLIHRNQLNRCLQRLEERAVPATSINPYAQVQAVVVNGGEEQRSMVTSITVELDRPVEFMSEPVNAFELTRSSDGQPVEMLALVRESKVLLTFVGGPTDGASLDDGRYSLRVIAEEIDHGKFDGNGDAEPGDDYLLEASREEAPAGIYRLFGDVTGDGHTDLADFMTMRKVLGTKIEADRSYIAALDANGDGQIDLEDFAKFRQRLGMTA